MFENNKTQNDDGSLAYLRLQAKTNRMINEIKPKSNENTK